MNKRRIPDGFSISDDIDLPISKPSKSADIMSILIDTLQDFAEYDCLYGDGCPENKKTHHGTCIGCKARKTLQQCGIEIRK